VIETNKVAGKAVGLSIKALDSKPHGMTGFKFGIGLSFLLNVENYCKVAYYFKFVSATDSSTGFT
jgi:hypothetical protein